MKQALTSPPKKDEGKKKTAGHALGNVFEANPKKSNPDSSPQTRAGRQSSVRQRLANKFI